MKKVGCIISLSLTTAALTAAMLYEARISRGVELYVDSGHLRGRIGFLGYKLKFDLSDHIYINAGYHDTEVFEARWSEGWEFGGKETR